MLLLLHVKWGFFSPSLCLPPPLSLSWACATSVASVVMFLRSEWIHQHKNVLIIFIFYYTTRKPCQLGSQSSGHTEEGARAAEEKKSRRRRRDSEMGGWGFNNVNNEERNKEKGYLNEERSKRAAGGPTLRRSWKEKSWRGSVKQVVTLILPCVR